MWGIGRDWIGPPPGGADPVRKTPCPPRSASILYPYIKKNSIIDTPRECRNRVRRPRLVRAARQHAIPDSLGSFSARSRAADYRLFFSGLRTPRSGRISFANSRCPSSPSKNACISGSRIRARACGLFLHAACRVRSQWRRFPFGEKRQCPDLKSSGCKKRPCSRNGCRVSPYPPVPGFPFSFPYTG